jgi:hypothetical protein
MNWKFFQSILLFATLLLSPTQFFLSAVQNSPIGRRDVDPALIPDYIPMERVNVMVLPERNLSR